MSKPVKNWRTQVGDTPIFLDVVDDDLRFYGPHAAWRTLSRKDLGQRKTIFNGVIDLGYEQSELQALVGSLGGKKISPLPISGVGQEPQLGIEIKSPHTGGLTALNSLPFPQYRLAVTVDLQAPDANAIIQAIESGWAAKGLLNGRYEGSADGVSAKAGYKATIDTKRCIEDIVSSGVGAEMTTADAWNAIQAAIQRNQNTWLVYYGGGEGAGERSAAESALAALLFERCFDQVTTIRYDNGISAVAYRLRDSRTMGNPENRVFVQTAPAKVVVELPF